jgi:hypothetical protein
MSKIKDYDTTMQIQSIRKSKNEEWKWLRKVKDLIWKKTNRTEKSPL